MAGTRRRRPPARVRRNRRIAAGLVVTLLLLGAAAVGNAIRHGPWQDERGGSTSAVPTSDEAGPPRPRTLRDAPSTTAPPKPTGRFDVAPGNSPLYGPEGGRGYSYRVEVEQGIPVDPAAFAADVDRILSDPRGWITADGVRLQRVSDGSATFVIRLATPPSTDRLCRPLDTHRQVSCGKEAMAVINLDRWRLGSRPSKLPLHEYRSYVISHEVGHLLGHPHVTCPGPGALALTMMQQSYTIGACRPNAWPVPDAGPGR